MTQRLSNVLSTNNNYRKKYLLNWEKRGAGESIVNAPWITDHGLAD
jgi:hypothetical protein